MHGSQLHSIYTVKSKELNRKQSSTAAAKHIIEELAFLDYLNMDPKQKEAISGCLPATEGEDEISYP